MPQLMINGLEFHVDDVGTGPAILMLHGFPDSAALWRHQVADLVAAGFRVVVPDLRGFGASARPPAVADYRVEQLLGDVVGVLDALAVPQAHVVCHDWGASLGWLLAGLHADRVLSLNALAVGHPQAFYGGGLAQREKSWYMLLFQFEGLAERVLSENDWALFRDFVRHHDECERWLQDLSRPGALSAALNWYRANAHPAQTFRELSFPRVNVPAQGLWGSADPYLTEAQMVASASHVDGHWRYIRVEGAGHWLPLDRPQAVTRHVLDWLAAVAAVE